MNPVRHFERTAKYLEGVQIRKYIFESYKKSDERIIIAQCPLGF